jgi:hypothetical protein
MLRLPLIFLALAAGAQTAPPPLPWHLADIWWTLPEDARDFESLSVEIALDRDMPSADYNLYVSPITASFERGAKFYGGLQTNIGGFPAANPAQRRGADLGKGAIFSRWGDGLDLSYVRAEPDGYVESAGYEGRFVSGRRPYAWRAGTYVFEIRKLPRAADDRSGEMWLGAYVTDKASGVRTHVSSLKFEGGAVRLERSFASFVEFYGGKTVDIARLPPLEIRFGPLALNGRRVEPARVRVLHPRGSQSAAAPAILTVGLSADRSSVVCRLHGEIQAGRASDYVLVPVPATREKPGP